MLKTSFRASILSWYYRHKRDLPWRKSTDPYVIWLAEIILQQTRVSQGLPYFEKFVNRYPTVGDLANAKEDEVMKDWEGLGYYSRARNLHSTARYVSESLNGEFPRSYDELIKLKGIGSYTAAAISSFVTGEARAVLDGNVYRVLSRYFAVDTPINTNKGKKLFSELANDMLDDDNAADYNQGIMEFGAVQCVPKNPDCVNCVLSSGCRAYSEGLVADFPFKERKKYDRHRYFTFLHFENKGKVAVQQREGKDVWRKLFQFPMIEGSKLYDPEEVIVELAVEGSLLIKRVDDLKPHKLSHQTIHCRVLSIEGDKVKSELWGEQVKWVKREKLESFAFPKPLRAFLDRKQLTLPID